MLKTWVIVRRIRLDCYPSLGLMSTQGALGPALWFGGVSLAGHTLHLLVLLFALFGALMVSRIRIPKV